LHRTGTESLVLRGLEPCAHHDHSPNFEAEALHLFRYIARLPEDRVHLDRKPPQEERDCVEDEERAVRLFAVSTPRGAGQVMRAVLGDFVDVVNDRRARGELRAVPYGSRWAADRLGLDDRRVRDAVARLVRAGRLVEQGTLERTDGRRYGGTPLYALGVHARCPMSAGAVEGASFVGLDDEPPAATGDGQAAAQPGVEGGEVPAVAVAELEDVVGAGLAAAVGGAGGGGSCGERYAVAATSPAT
jgi:hypothetical protein